jgi:hypothetical protein
MPRDYYRTIQDLEDAFYGRGARDIMKADAPVLTTTTGVYNAIYGAKSWLNMNLEANMFGVLRKEPWNQSGWRVIRTRGSATVTGGVSENATLPDTIKPTWQEIATKPKTVAHAFNTSEVQQFLGGVDDSLGDTMEALREYMAKEHAEHINKMLLQNVTTLAGDNEESVDRVISSNNEVTNCGDVDAGDSDIYSIDRDAAASWADAYVNENANVDRDLTLALVDSLFQNVWTNGGDPKFLFTGYDTNMRLEQLLQAQQRFVEQASITPSVNGVQGIEGVAAGFIVATYNKRPIIPSKNTVQDTISRLYAIDSDYLTLRVAKPTQYFESGIESGDPFGINYLGQEGLYRTLSELICYFFGAQGKLRDLQ